MLMMATLDPQFQKVIAALVDGDRPHGSRMVPEADRSVVQAGLEKALVEPSAMRAYLSELNHTHQVQFSSDSSDLLPIERVDQILADSLGRLTPEELAELALSPLQLLDIRDQLEAEEPSKHWLSIIARHNREFVAMTEILEGRSATTVEDTTPVPTAVSSRQLLLTSDETAELLKGVENGQEDAAQKIADCYFERLVEDVRERMDRKTAAIRGPESIVNSVMKSLVVRIREGQYSHLDDSDSLWHILASKAACRVAKAYQLANSEKQDGPADRADRLASSNSLVDVEQFFEQLPLEECVERGLDLLDPFARKVAELSLQGLKDSEIARKLKAPESSIVVASNYIRTLWERLLAG